MKFTQTITGNKRIKTLLESRKTEIFLVAVILLTAIFVRAYHFGAPPIGVHQDEAMAAVDAKALAEYGTDRIEYIIPFGHLLRTEISCPFGN